MRPTATIHCTCCKPPTARLRPVRKIPVILDAEGEAVTYGFGADLLANLRASGSFQGRTVELDAAESWDLAKGCFEWAWPAGNARLKLTQLVLTSAGETWLGSAETASNGELMLNLSAGDKKLQTSEALFGAPRSSGP